MNSSLAVKLPCFFVLFLLAAGRPTEQEHVQIVSVEEDKAVGKGRIHWTEEEILEITETTVVYEAKLMGLSTNWWAPWDNDHWAVECANRPLTVNGQQFWSSVSDCEANNWLTGQWGVFYVPMSVARGDLHRFFDWTSESVVGCNGQTEVRGVSMSDSFSYDYDPVALCQNLQYRAGGHFFAAEDCFVKEYTFSQQVFGVFVDAQGNSGQCSDRLMQMPQGLPSDLATPFWTSSELARRIYELRLTDPSLYTTTLDDGVAQFFANDNYACDYVVAYVGQGGQAGYDSAIVCRGQAVTTHQDTCFVVFEGSNDGWDWVNNFQAVFGFGNFHPGVQNELESLKKHGRLMDSFDSLCQGASSYQISGHSLGAALANLFSYEVIKFHGVDWRSLNFVGLSDPTPFGDGLYSQGVLYGNSIVLNAISHGDVFCYYDPVPFLLTHFGGVNFPFPMSTCNANGDCSADLVEINAPVQGSGYFRPVHSTPYCLPDTSVHNTPYYLGPMASYFNDLAGQDGTWASAEMCEVTETGSLLLALTGPPDGPPGLTVWRPAGTGATCENCRPC